MAGVGELALRARINFYRAARAAQVARDGYPVVVKGENGSLRDTLPSRLPQAALLARAQARVTELHSQVRCRRWWGWMEGGERIERGTHRRRQRRDGPRGADGRGG